MIHGKWPTSRQGTYDSGRSSGRNTVSLRARRAPMRRALDVFMPYLILMGMPYFVSVPSPPEAHEGTVGDQTPRDIKVGAMGEGAGENRKALETRVPRALEGLLPRCD